MYPLFAVFWYRFVWAIQTANYYITMEFVEDWLIDHENSPKLGLFAVITFLALAGALMIEWTTPIRYRSAGYSSMVVAATTAIMLLQRFLPIKWHTLFRTTTLFLTMYYALALAFCIVGYRVRVLTFS